jgi:hypothetical protein
MVVRATNLDFITYIYIYIFLEAGNPSKNHSNQTQLMPIVPWKTSTRIIVNSRNHMSS